MRKSRDNHQKLFGCLQQTPLFFVLLFLLLLPPIARGQESPITAAVNRTQYTTDDLVILTVTVVDESPQQPRPILPPLEGLAVIEFDIATSVSMVNGNIQTEVVYTYQLQPRRTGQLTIPPVTVKIDDQIYKAAPITIRVSQGTAPAPSPGNAVPPSRITPPAGLEEHDFFAEATVDTSTPYIGQQVIYTFRFYQALKLYQRPQYEMPLFNGFDTVGLPVQEYNLDIEGRTYLISEVRMALFPKTVGSVTIGSARLMIPGNFFEKPLELYTGPTALQVKPLPNSAPPGFKGAVGQYQIEAQFSPQVAVVNQPATLSVAVSGSGNVHTLPEPIWPALNNWRSYDSASNVTTVMKDGQVTGTRVFERVILSDRVGDFVIPPTKLVYFDPAAGEYRTISSRSISGRIIPAPTPDPAQPAATPAIFNQFDLPEQGQSGAVIRISPDLLASVWQVILPVSVVALWVLCGVVPLAVVGGAVGFWAWQKRQQQVAAKAQALQQPRQKMHSALAQTLAHNQDNYRAVQLAIQIYLSQQLGVAAKGLTHSDLEKRLREQGLAAALVNNIKDCLIQSEIGRYGPKTEDAGWQLVAQTDELLRELDRAFEKNPSRS